MENVVKEKESNNKPRLTKEEFLIMLNIINLIDYKKQELQHS